MLWVPRDQPVLQVKWEALVYRAIMEIQVLVESQDNQVVQVVRVQQGLLDPRVQQVPQGRRVKPVTPVTRDRLVNLVLGVTMALQVALEPLVPRVRQDSQAQ